MKQAEILIKLDNLSDFLTLEVKLKDMGYEKRRPNINPTLSNYCALFPDKEMLFFLDLSNHLDKLAISVEGFLKLKPENEVSHVTLKSKLDDSFIFYNTYMKLGILPYKRHTMEKKYELIKDLDIGGLKTNLTTATCTRAYSESEWLKSIPILSPGDCERKTEWFKEVKEELPKLQATEFYGTQSGQRIEIRTKDRIENNKLANWLNETVLPYYEKAFRDKF